MARKNAAKRYAQAAFEIAVARGELEQWQSDLGKIAQISQDSVFLTLLENPKLPFPEKVRFLTGQLGDVNPLALNLAYLLVARGRFSLAGHIAGEYQELADSYRGIAPVAVVTAVPLDEADKLRLVERLEGIVGQKVVLKSAVDASLLGGIVARFGGKLLDGSTRYRLEALKKEMSGTRK